VGKLNDSAEFAECRMAERFFVEQPIAGGICTLASDEARHLAAVMRAKVGDEVVVFDGSGAEFLASVTAMRKQAIELDVLERREVSRELDFELTLAVALPKGERQKWLVEKATELGVTRLVPLVTERGVAQPLEGTLARLRRTVIEASKQCGRNRLLEVGDPVEAGPYFAAEASVLVRLIGEASGQSLGEVEGVKGAAGVVAAIGPEGGFTAAEIEVALRARWQPVCLGPRVLRVETAAVAMAAWASVMWK
jgi:16S rRNA (uracil1498-N3)-methyltransferase